MRRRISAPALAMIGLVGCGGPKEPGPTTAETVAAQKQAEQEVQSAESAMQKKQPKVVVKTAEDEERARSRGR